MLRQFFRKLSPRHLFSGEARIDTPDPFVPPGERVYAIGDIHGRSDLLSELHAKITDDAAQAGPDVRNTLVYLGDYIDRGFDSKGVIEQLAGGRLGDFNNGPRNFEKLYLKGNHEELFLRFLEDASVGPAWFALGGAETLLSYGVPVPATGRQEEKFQYIQKELLKKVPQGHRQFFESLELYHCVGSYIFVHAGIRPGIPVAQQKSRDILWIRDTFLKWSRGFEKIVVHGHSFNNTPNLELGRIGIDTGAYATNILTCIVIEGKDYRFLTTGPRQAA